MYSIGIVLSGGGAKGFAHLGVLQALQEIGIKPDIVSGVSSGAIVGAFLAAGYSPLQTLDIIKENKLGKYFKILWKGMGFLDMNQIKCLFEKYFPDDSFSSLKIPLYISATDLLQSKTIYFSSGSLIKAIMGSSALPVIFTPVKYQQYLLVDGGVLNNLPVEPLVGKCKKIVGIHVNHISPEFKHQSKIRVLERSFHIAIANTVRNRAKQCNIFIEPTDMAKYSMFNVSKAEEIFEAGYEYTLNMRKYIEQKMLV